MSAAPRNRVEALSVIYPTEAELAAHQIWLHKLAKDSGGHCVWQQLEAE
jgi:hypothetical protein